MINVKNFGKYVPANVYTNDDLSKFVETSDEWIFTRTGIKERRIASGENTSDLCVNAVKSMNEDISDIDFIIVGTTTPDCATPQVSSLVQAKLGLNSKEIFCLDVNSACTGFMYALEVGRSLMVAKKSFKKGIVIGAEVLSKMIDYTDRNTCVLFGDGAGCVLLEKTTGEGGVLEGFQSSTGDIDMTLCAKNWQLVSPETNERIPATYVQMQGQAVFKFAVRAIEQSVHEVLRINGMQLSDVDLFITHQANERIIIKASEMLDLPLEKFFMNLSKYGNTSAASIPMALYDAVEEGKAKKGDTVLLVGFGGGLSYGASIIKL